MYINYYELRNFVDMLVNKYKENDLKGMFILLDNCNFINVIGDAINIDVEDDNYKLYFYTSYIGTMKSDFNYDINNLKTKINILKYLLRTNDNCIYKFLSCLINMNAYKLMFDNCPDITIVSNMTKRENKIREVGKNYYSFDCETSNEVYNGTSLIGVYNYSGPFYALKNNINNDYTSRTIEIDDKNTVLKELINYNNAYYKKNIVNSNTSKSIVK